jgi:iron complex outermembrane receptor protein
LEELPRSIDFSSEGSKHESTLGNDKVKTGAVQTLAIVVAYALLMATNVIADIRNVNVAAGDLVDALESLAKQCGVDVIYPSGQLEGLQTAGVRGALEPLEAFRKLVEGTPLMVTQRGSSILVALPTDDRQRETQETPHTSKTPRAIQDHDDGEFIGAAIQEIVVTAQKRTERLSDVPQSAVALSGLDLSRHGVTTLQDLAAQAPGISLTSVGGVGSQQITLRGISIGTDIAPSVGIYVDDVPYGSGVSYSGSAQ